MVTVELVIGLMHNNPFRTDYHRSEIAILTLKTVPERSEDGPNGRTYYGQWSCPSIYVGKELSGKYLIKRLDQFDASDYHPIDKRIQNPVGMFFDSRSTTSPFLILYEFSPGVVPTKRGFGMINYSPDIIWPGVDWSLPKGK